MLFQPTQEPMNEDEVLFADVQCTPGTLTQRESPEPKLKRLDAMYVAKDEDERQTLLDMAARQLTYSSDEEADGEWETQCLDDQSTVAPPVVTPTTNTPGLPGVRATAVPNHQWDVVRREIVDVLDGGNRVTAYYHSCGSHHFGPHATMSEEDIKAGKEDEQYRLRLTLIDRLRDHAEAAHDAATIGILHDGCFDGLEKLHANSVAAKDPQAEFMAVSAIRTLQRMQAKLLEARDKHADHVRKYGRVRLRFNNPEKEDDNDETKTE